MGEPLHVAADADEHALEAARVMLETRLRDLQARALTLLA